ncbi:hypothetical protein [Roseateles sp.]|uniref:hypothetical protein n=1 Tax=Roseateles sp. TaxID=1971397 RepID=UPI003D0A5815
MKHHLKPECFVLPKRDQNFAVRFGRKLDMHSIAYSRKARQACGSHEFWIVRMHVFETVLTLPYS